MFVVQAIKRPLVCFTRLSISKVLSIIVFLIVPFFCSPNTYAAKVTLAWDENDGENLAGYSLYCRVEGHAFDYDDPLWEGSETVCTIHNLQEGTGYYFIIRAFDVFGNESGNSGEVFYQQV